MVRKSIAISLVLAALALLALLLPVERWAHHPAFLAEHIELYGADDAQLAEALRQNVAHKAWVLLIGIACACIVLRPRS